MLRAFQKRLQIDIRWPDAERFDVNTQPSCLASHRFRRISTTGPLIGTRRRPSAVLLSGTKITRSCQSKFSIRMRKSSLSFLIPVSRIKMTISRQSSRVRGAPVASQSSRYQFPFRFIVKTKVSSMLFHHFYFRSMADHHPLLRFVQHSSQCSQSAVGICEPGNFNCSAQSPVIWSTLNIATHVDFSNRQPLR